MVWQLSRVEAAFGANRTADPTTIPASAWVDITTDTARWGDSKGRSYELADIQSGTATVDLHNTDAQYSPGYNPSDGNLLDTARQSGGSSLGGVLPDNMILSSGLTNVTLACGATADVAFQHTFAYEITVLAGATGTPKLFTGATGDTVAGPFTISECIRVDPATQYTFSFQHKLISGAGTSVTANIHWLDSSGAILSSSASGAFTPTGTVTQRDLTANSDASARYAALSIKYTGVPAAAHVYQFTALQMVLGSSTTLLNPVYWPNIRPGVPVRIKIKDSGGTYRNGFYGFTGEWVEDIDGSMVSVDLVDVFELLAEIDLKTATDEQINLISPTISIPLNDPSGTRSKFAARTSTGAELTRSVKGTAAAADTSEYTFGVEGPQDGTSAVYFDPESATVGYGLKVTVPSELCVLSSSESSSWGWFKVRHRELDARNHLLFWQVASASGVTLEHEFLAMFDGSVQVAISGLSGSVGLASVGTDYADGEWHLMVLTSQSATQHMYVDWDGTNGEHITDTTATYSAVTARSSTIYLGGSPDYATLMARASMSNWATVDRTLTDAEIQALYATGAPPSIYPGETEDVRIGRLLDFAGWPAAQRNLDPGLSTIVGPHPTDTNLLDAIKRTAESAGGVVYVNKSGKVCYANRQARYNPTTALTCSAAGMSEPENDIIPAIDSAQIYNRVRVARATGDAVEANDLTSQARYGIRTLDLDMSVLSDDDALQAANWFLHVYSEPVMRVGSVTFAASASSGDTLWDYLVNLDLMSREAIDLGVVRLAGLLFFVEQIDRTYDQETLTFSGTLQLSPADAYTNICTLDDATYGLLDSCVLGW